MQLEDYGLHLFNYNMLAANQNKILIQLIKPLLNHCMRFQSLERSGVRALDFTCLKTPIIVIMI